MNLKNFLKVLFTLGVLTILISATTFAQTVWYVNNSIGNDGRNGLSANIPTPDDFVTGPKKTIGGPAGALASSNPGDVIVVEYTGIPYSAGTGEPATIAVTSSRKFESIQGTNTALPGSGANTPSVTVLFQMNTGAAANNLTFDSGTFTLNGGLQLTTGTLVNSSGLVTVGGTVTRDVAAATVSGQLAYTGTVNFVYNGGATITTGNEFPAAGGSLGALTTNGAGTVLTINRSVTMTGILNTSDALNLGGNVLSINGANNHNVGGNITNGTLSFLLTGGVNVAGAFTLPNVTANKTSSGIGLLTLTNATAVQSLLAQGNASITATAATTINTAGNTTDVITNSGNGVVTLSAATTVNGNVNLNAQGLNANTEGNVTFGAAAPITINGNVTNQGGFTLDNTANMVAGAGNISFPDQNITITGNVVDNATYGGTVGTSTNANGSGLINFASTGNNVTINGSLTNSSNATFTSSAVVVGLAGNGSVLYATTTGVNRVDGGVTNSSNWSSLTGAAVLNNGQINFGSATRVGVSTIGTTANRVGTLTNSSVAKDGTGNGNILFGTASGFFGTNVNVSGSADGGYTLFGNEKFDVSGSVTNSRNSAKNNLDVGAGGGAATVTVAVGGNVSVSSKGNIRFLSTQDGAVTVTGTVQNTGSGTIVFSNITSSNVQFGALNVTSGTVSIPAGTGTFNVGAFTATGTGTVNLIGTGALTITGPINWTTASIDFTGRPSVTTNTTTINIGDINGNPTFGGAAPLIIGNPTPSSLVTMTFGPLAPAYPGAFTINNTTGLATAVKLAGGNFVPAGLVTFQSGFVQIDQSTLVIKSITGANDFQNVAGYTTTTQGRVSMSGTGGTQQVTGGGQFGDFEVNENGGTVSFAAIGGTNVFTSTFYLTLGNATTAGNINFNNLTVLPTVVVNKGTFDATPNYVSNVNVTYIGTDKTSSFELPVVPSTKLQNLTVATTTGTNVANKGAVTINANVIVNGTIAVNSGQTLVIADAKTITMNGPSVVLNGDMTNGTAGSGVLLLNAAAGTNITGSGFLPSIQVGAGSTGNVINGATALVNGLLGADNIRGGAGLNADFDPTAASANGNLTLNNGTAGITLTFGTGVAFDKSNLNNITTNNAANSLVLGANLTEFGNVTHNAGNINLQTFTWTYMGTTPAVTGGATITGTGTLTFVGGATVLSCNTSDVTIAANININLTAPGTQFTINPGTAGNLIAAGNLTVTKGDVVLGNGGTARNLTVTGSNLTLAANGTVDVVPTGSGTLILNAATAPLTFTYSGTPAINKLQISNDVNLAGTGTALTVTTFTHTAGVLNFGTENLTLLSMTRTGGSYLSSGGYMILGAAVTYDQGNGFSIPNLRFTANATLSNAAGRGQITVTSNLDLQQAGTVTTNGQLAVADLSTVNYTSGTFSAAPAYANTITLNAVNFANGSGLTANVWPNTAGLVTTLTINGTLAGNTITIPGNRQVNGTLNLTSGVLTLGANTLTLSSNTTIHRTDNGSVTVAGGGIAFPADNSVNLSYESTGGAIGTGPEFPAVMNNLTVTRTGNIGNSTLTVNTAATVNGTLTIKNNFTAAAGAQLTVLGPTVIALDSFTNATPPVVTFAATSPLVFGGATGQTLTLPATGSTIGFMRLNLTGNAPVLNVMGGNLTIPNFGTLFFTNGVLNMGTNTLVLPNPQLASIAGTTNGLAFDRSAVTGANVGVVVGNISRFANTGDGGVGTDGRFEFPTGNLAGQYRPAAITFTPSYPVGVPTNIVVKNVDTAAGGTRDLPLDGGGVTIGNYPNFYWLISTMPQSMTGTQNFDIELTAHNIGYPYNSYNDLRMIRRQDGNSQQNGWQLQGFAPNYSNYQVVNGTDTTVTVRTTSSQGGLVTAGSRFTMGVPSRAPLFTAPVVTNYAQNEATTLTVQFTATAQDVGATITGYTLNAGAPSWASLNPTTGLLTLTPTYGNGSNTPYVFTVTATSSNGLTTPLSITDTVHIVDRPPVFTQVLPNSTIKNDSLFTFTYKATDPDAGQTLTFSLVSVKPTPTVAPSITSAGVFTWTPSFADINKTDTVIVQVSDGTLAVKDTALVTIKFARKMGDVAGNGGADPASASLVLQYSVGAITLTQQQLYAADVDGNGQVNAYDAANILYAYAHHDTTISGNVLMKSSARGSVVFGKLVGQSNSSTVVLPISLSNSANVYSAYVELNIDNNYANIENVAGSLPQGWVMSHNYSNGVLKIAMAGTTPLRDGNIAEISLNLKDKETHFTVTGTAELNANYSTELGNLTVKQIPNQFELSQNYPNPFNPTTTIKYQLAQNSKVTLEIYDMLGQRIKTLVNDVQDAGYYSVSWDGSNNFGQQVSSGIYIYRLQAGSFVKTLKMNLLK